MLDFFQKTSRTIEESLSELNRSGLRYLSTGGHSFIQKISRNLDAAKEILKEWGEALKGLRSQVMVAPKNPVVQSPVQIAQKTGLEKSPKNKVNQQSEQSPKIQQDIVASHLRFRQKSVVEVMNDKESEYQQWLSEKSSNVCPPQYSEWKTLKKSTYHFGFEKKRLSIRETDETREKNSRKTDTPIAKFIQRVY